MRVKNTYIRQNPKERLTRQAELHRHCILLLKTLNKEGDAR